MVVGAAIFDMEFVLHTDAINCTVAVKLLRSSHHSAKVAFEIYGLIQLELCCRLRSGLLLLCSEASE
jgi:hypothetical protein